MLSGPKSGIWIAFITGISLLDVFSLVELILFNVDNCSDDDDADDPSKNRSIGS